MKVSKQSISAFIFFQLKDVELDKIHNLFKFTSRKLEDMNDIISNNHQFEVQIKESHATIQQLEEEKKLKQERIERLNREMEELKRNSSAMIETDKAWQEIKDRAALYDGVVKERNGLKSQLCKMVGIEDLLQKFKKRADEADRMEAEIERLQRELQRSGHGAAGDETFKRVQSACKHCREYANQLERLQSSLDVEIKKNVKTESERNFLRQRVRSMDVIEAEMLIYKVR